MLPYVCYTVWDTIVLYYHLTSQYYAILYLYITLSHYTVTVANLNSSCCHDTSRYDTFHGCTIHLRYITSHCYTHHQHTLPLLHSTKRYVTSHCICVMPQYCNVTPMDKHTSPHYTTIIINYVTCCIAGTKPNTALLRNTVLYRHKTISNLTLPLQYFLYGTSLSQNIRNIILQYNTFTALNFTQSHNTHHRTLPHFTLTLPLRSMRHHTIHMPYDALQRFVFHCPIVFCVAALYLTIPITSLYSIAPYHCNTAHLATLLHNSLA